MPPTVSVSLLAPLLALGLAAGSVGAGPADASRLPKASAATPAAAVTPVQTGRTFFGVHDSDPVGASWPAAPVGLLRVWDAGAAWNQIETSPGVFNFSRLDAIVTTARSHQSDVLIVLGQTPAFYATAPSPDAAYGPGASSMPTLAAWRKYVDTVVRRYHGPGIQFQVWNEANVIGYWSGTPQQMADLTGAARTVINKIDPAITLVGPAFITRLSSQQQWMDSYFASRAGGKLVGNLIDVVSLQLYPVPDTPTPEASMQQLAVDRGILAARGVTRPVWVTEINYGGRGGRTVPPAPLDEQASKVARTYLLNAANGVRRVIWYAWDLSQPILDTFLVEPDRVTPTAAGRAFSTVQRWMLATTVQGCPVDSDGTYTCTLVKAGKKRLVLWNPTGTAQVTVPAGMTVSERLLGAEQPVTAGTILTVDRMPLLLR